MLIRIKHSIDKSVGRVKIAGKHCLGEGIATSALLVSVIVAGITPHTVYAQPANLPVRLDLPPNFLTVESQPQPVKLTQEAEMSHPELGQHIRQVLDRHPGLLRSEAHSRAAEYRIEEAKGARYPQLVVTGDVGREHRDRPSVDTEKFNRAQAQLRVVMPLYDPEVNAQIAQRDSAATSAGWQLTDKREQLVLQTIEAYIGLARATRLLAMAQDSLKTHRQYVAQVKASGKNHAGYATNMPAATARVALAEAVLTRYLHQLENARTTWWQMTGLQAPNQIQNVPFASLPDTLDDALAQAHQENPEIKLAQADIALAKKGADAERASYKPRVNIEMRSRNGRDWDGVSGHQVRNYAGLTFEWKAFNGFSDRYASKAAQEEVLAAQYAFDERHQALRMRIEQEWFNLQSSDAALQSYQAYASQARLMVDASTGRFKQGQRPLLDVLDAEKELLSARIQLEIAHQDMVLSSWRLLALQGRIQSVLER